MTQTEASCEEGYYCAKRRWPLNQRSLISNYSHASLNDGDTF